MADNNFQEIVGTMMKGMEGFLSSKTVVGEPTQIGDTTIIPLVDVTFGVGAGASVQEKKNGGGGGMSGKMSPSAVLVINNGTTRLVNVKNTDNLSRALDLIPEIMNKIKSNKDVSDEEIRDTAFPNGEVVE